MKWINVYCVHVMNELLEVFEFKLCNLASDNYLFYLVFDIWSCLYHTGQVPMVHVGVNPPDGELNIPGVEEPQSTPSAGLVGGCSSL